MIKLFTAFAGYGTDNFALKQLGIPYELVGFSEINEYAIKCFKQNHQGNNYGDISKIDWNIVPDFDLITAGFPCQDVSNAGKQNLNKGRTILGMELTKALKIKQPKYFLFENVKGLMSDKFKDFKEQLIKSWEDCGYKVYSEVLNTKDFGIPQSRSRVFFVGIRKDIKQDFKFPEKEELKIYLKELLEDLPFRDIPPFQSGKYGNKDRMDCLKCVDDLYFHTMTINRTHANQYLLSADKKKCRLFSKKEAFRLQGFLKDEVNLDGLSDNQAYRLAGNGQSVNVVTKIFSQLLKSEEVKQEAMQSEARHSTQA
jgi:DNA (cytosine-5)-methyltransferase 1